MAIMQTPYSAPMTMDPGIRPSTETSLEALFNNPNFINMLARVAQGLDPQGVGGALGGAAVAFNKDVAAQRGAAALMQRQRILDENPSGVLGQLMTPRGMPGLTSVSRLSGGDLRLEYTPPASGLAPSAGEQPAATALQPAQPQRQPTPAEMGTALAGEAPKPVAARRGL